MTDDFHGELKEIQMQDDKLSRAFGRIVDIAYGFGLAAVVVMVATLLLGCQPPPVWEPGDKPLTIWAPEDGVWMVTLEGCDAWAMTGLECVREEVRSAATVEVVMGDATDTAAADTAYAWQVDGHWEYEVTVDVSTMLEAARGNGAYARTVMAHEIGHLLGIWDHLEDDTRALMTAGTISPTPTADDLAALPFEVVQ